MSASRPGGNDIRTALITFGVDSSHGYERTHLDGLVSVPRLLAAYAQSRPLFLRDRKALAPLEGFPDQALGPEEMASEPGEQCPRGPPRVTR